MSFLYKEAEHEKVVSTDFSHSIAFPKIINLLLFAIIRVFTTTALMRYNFCRIFRNSFSI